MNRAATCFWFFLILCCSVPSLAASEEEDCRFISRKIYRTKQIASFRVILDRFDGEYGAACRARVFSADKKVVFRAEDWNIELVKISGSDLNNDAEPDIIFEGYSGGAHCCWTYWVVSAGAHPGLLLNIENERPIEFRRDKYGRYEMWTYDGAFDYFDELSHAETVFPRVILGLEGRDLVNLNVKHRSAYDKEIRDARKNLTPSKIAALRSAKNPYYDQLETSITVLTIVLAQLYGGREREGWKTLEQMWPSHDVARLTALIKKTRAEGVLAYLPPRSRAALEPVLSRRIPVATAR